MNLMMPIAIFISGILTLRMVDRFVFITPLFQAGIDVVFIRINQRFWCDCCFNNRLNCFLFDIIEHTYHHLAAALHHTKNRRFIILSRAATAFAFQTPPSTWATTLFDFVWLPFMTCNYINFITFNLIGQLNSLFFTTIPSRSWVVIAWASSLLRPNSAAICRLDRFRPMKYRQIIHTFSG